jgi:hypothetical protein
MEYPRQCVYQFQLQLQQQWTKVCVREKVNHNAWKKGECGPYDDFMSQLPLFYRAWAFQGRLLATRIVHFGPKELVWECRSWISCECQALEHRANRLEFGAAENVKTKYAQMISPSRF